MTTAEAIAKLKEKMEVKESTTFDQTTLEFSRDKIKEALKFFKAEGYAVLMDLTGVDYLEPEKKTKILYFLHHPGNYSRVRLITFVRREETLPSVVDIWAGADWYERELWDLFGIHFEGHPELKRILMPDDWIGHPLLKDYALSEVPVEFKHGVKPKVPSEIIPHISEITPNVRLRRKEP